MDEEISRDQVIRDIGRKLQEYESQLLSLLEKPEYSNDKDRMDNDESLLRLSVYYVERDLGLVYGSLPIDGHDEDVGKKLDEFCIRHDLDRRNIWDKESAFETYLSSKGREWKNTRKANIIRKSCKSSQRKRVFQSGRMSFEKIRLENRVNEVLATFGYNLVN